jgi:WD40 repeat protein
VTGDQPLAVLGRMDGTVELWNLAARNQVASWKAGTNELIAAAFSPDGTSLATGDAGGLVKIWKTATHAETTAVRVFDQPELRLNISLFRPRISLCFSPDGETLALAEGNSKVVRLWNVATQRDVLRLDQNAAGVVDLSFSPDGRWFAACAMKGSEARVWELPSGRPFGSALRGHVNGVVQVAFAPPDARTIATGAYDGKVKLWNVATQQEVATFPVTGVFRGLRFSPDGRTLAVSSWVFPVNRVELFRAPSFEEIAAIEKVRPRTLQP